MASAVTSIYNNIISAASAGFAPTNSADVSAIASAYAESAASGKLDSTASSSFYPSDNPSGFISSVDLSDYATTAYVDSSVSSKLDATASSQFLTAVPSDYATTAYVDSSVSSKLDATASSQFLTSTAGLVGTADLSAYAYESSNSAKLDTTAFSTVSSNFLTSIPSDYATTAYVDSSISGFAYESAVSGWTAKQDALTFGYDTANNISSIDGSALAGDGGGVVTSLQYYTSGATSTASGTANGFARAGNSTGSINYYTLDFGEHDPSCITAIQYSQILITADKNADFMTALPLVSSDLSAFTVYKSVADTAEFSSVPDSAKSYVGRLSTITSDLGTAVRYNLTSNNFSSIKTGEENVLVLAYEYLLDHWGTLSVTGTTGSFGFRYGSSSGYSAVSGVNELGLYFDTSNCYPTSNPSGFISSVDLSNYATTAYVDSSVSSKLDATASSQFITSTAGLVGTGDLTAYAYESAVSGWTAKQDALTFGYDTSNNISSIDGSAIGGQGGIDSATCSAIASAYAESAASSKQDTLTFGYDGTSISSIDGSSLAGGGGLDSATCSAIASAYAESAVSAASGNYYPATSNPSGYLTAQVQASWSESASASPSYIQDKPDLVDIVAGPGIHIDNPDGNTLRVSMAADYETVLCTDTSNTNTHTLSESPYNFKYLRFEFFASNYSSLSINAVLVPMSQEITAINVLHGIASTSNWGMDNELYTVSSSTITMTHSHRLLNNWTTNSIVHQQDGVSNVKRIIGINRTASAQ